MLLKAPRGTKDILPKEIPAWQEIESKSRQVFSLYNYQEIRTPIYENISLFKRSLGSTTDIVQKQMFVFKRGKEQFVLRPEATASIARAYLENNLGFGVKLRKLFYIGPMFRAERPQRGRLRQFHHIGVEAIGSFSPSIDIELIELSDSLLKALGITDYKFIINSLGCKNDKDKFGALLKKSLTKHKKKLCRDCKRRLSKNIFRVLDCKNEQCKQIAESLKFNHSYLCENCKSCFDRTLEGLNRLNINYKVREQLVRGLDYYSGVVFEITHPNLGAQDALGAGGRYDYLFEELANAQIGAAGFALGFDRLILVASKEPLVKQLVAYIITLGDEALDIGLRLAREVRSESISCDFDHSAGSLKSKLKEADRSGAKFTIIIGEDEIKKGKVVVRHMKESRQEEVEINNIVDFIKTNIEVKS